MLRKTPLKNKDSQLKKTSLKSNSKGLKACLSLKKGRKLNITTIITKTTIPATNKKGNEYNTVEPIVVQILIK